MGEIVPFRRVPDVVGNQPKGQPPIPIRIPSARDLYDEAQTRSGGESIASIRQKLAKSPPQEQREALQTLEVGLVTARLACIREDVKYASLADRNREIAELGKHTYGVALDLEFDALREIAAAMLTEGLGTWERAARAIEGIKTVRLIGR